MNKHKIVLITLVTLLLISASGLVVAYFAANYMLNEIKPAPQEEEQEEVAVDDDETAGWQTYRNEEYGFEVEYPPGEIAAVAEGFRGWSQGDIFQIDFYNPDVVPLDAPLFFVSVFSGLNSESLHDWTKAHPEAYGADEEVEYSKQESISIGGIDGLLFSEPNDFVPVQVAFVTRDSKVFVIGIFEVNDSQQILSTFKFIE